jgi:hypothetical protein
MSERRVDHSALRTNQAFIITLLALAFVLDAPLLAAFVGAVMIIGTIWPEAGLFKRIYRHLLRPAGIVRPDVIIDNPEPHLFAQGLGGAVLAAAFVALLAGLEIVGWALVGVVIVLAGLNLFAGWCAGCTIYYWLNRLGVPGFSRARIEARR